MKWKSIKEDPPTMDMIYCLVCDENNPDDRGISAQYSDKRKEFYNIFNALYLSLDDITHWMNIPSYSEAK